MRSAILILVGSMPASTVSVAQEFEPRDTPAESPAAGLQSYVVQLTEFQLESSSDPKLTADNIVQSFDEMANEGKLEVVQIIRLSALERRETMVQFGKMVTVTSAVLPAGPGRGESRRTQQLEVGTLARLTAEPQEGKVLLQLSYEASRVEGDGHEDSPPEIRRIQFHTSLLIEPGKPVLVGGVSIEETSFLLVSITE